MAHDASTEGIVSSGPNAKIIKNLDLTGRGERNVANATTDVWAHDGYAYTGTFNSPCGGDPEAGIWIWDVHNNNNPGFVGIIQSPTGSRSNDVRVDTMNSGDVLVHSNESCGGGPGGFEVYNVDDPSTPVHLASVQTDDVNQLLRDNFGFVDFGVHNLWLFTQGDKDYVAATVESEFGNFQIFDITDPASPSLVGFWGAEQIDASKSAYPSARSWFSGSSSQARRMYSIPVSLRSRLSATRPAHVRKSGRSGMSSAARLANSNASFNLRF